jgi:hypothetical protein
MERVKFTDNENGDNGSSETFRIHISVSFQGAQQRNLKDTSDK